MDEIKDLVKAVSDEDLCDALSDIICDKLGVKSGGVYTQSYNRKHAFISEYLRRLLGVK